MDVYEKLLAKVWEGSRNFLSYAPLSEYNIFHVLDVSTKEVVMCRFLVDLLNPCGEHGCGILFLKSFLQDVLGVPFGSAVNDTLLWHTDVMKEFVIDNDRRIDIIIRNASFVIPIEVKIYAEEQEGQCFDYYKKARNAPLVYLTRFGDTPSEYSRKRKGSTDILSEDHIKCISWAGDISNWLTSLLLKLKEPVKSIIMQYIDAVSVFADERDKKAVEKTMEILLESPDYFSAGLEIEKAMKSAKLRLMRLVLDEFKEEMKTVASQYGLEPEKDAIYYTYEEKCTEKFYDSGGTTYPGLNYIVKNARYQKESIQMWFRIEVEYNLYAGITLFDTEAAPKDGISKGYEVDEITAEMMEESAQYLDRNIFRPVNWWITWCYPNGRHDDGYYDEVPDFRNMNRCAVSLVDERKRKEYARSAVKSFEEHILKHLLAV